MKLKTKMYKKVKNQLDAMGFYKVSFDKYHYRPAGEIVTQDLDRGYFEVDLNNDETRIRINFILLEIEPIIINL
jgi:hypothetical protein